MANLVPTLSYVSFEVARTCEETPGTRAARAKCEQLTAAIADAVNNVPEADVLLFVKSLNDLPELLAREREVARGMVKTVLDKAPSAGAAARWLIIMHTSRELMWVARTLVEYRRAMTFESRDVEEAVHWLEARATPLPRACVLLGTLEDDDNEGEAYVPPEEQEEEELEEEEDDDEEEGEEQEDEEEEEEEEEEEKEEEEGEELGLQGQGATPAEGGKKAVGQAAAPAVPNPKTLEKVQEVAGCGGGSPQQGSGAAPRGHLSSLTNAAGAASAARPAKRPKRQCD
ncbi:unnamed protein product [Ectocarpus sp. 6 AP-2014]